MWVLFVGFAAIDPGLSSLRGPQDRSNPAVASGLLRPSLRCGLAMTSRFERNLHLARLDRYHARNGLVCAGHLRGQFEPAGELDLDFRPFRKHQNEGLLSLWPRLGGLLWRRAFKALGHALERLLLA